MASPVLASVAASIPSPVVGVWQLGPIPLRAYAFCLLAGILFAAWYTGRRLPAKGIEADQVVDIALWVVPIGIVGARIYHVVSSPQAYFGAGGRPLDAFKIWEGGLGIWGAVAFGALGAWIACRRHHVDLLAFGDALAPALAIAQAIGRLGNWFNNELYGAPTDLPWGLEIHQWDHTTGRAVVDAAGNPIVIGTFHPTFLYEALWCLLIAAALLWWERRRDAAGRPLARGQLFAAYVMAYTAGRFVVENLRIDDANHILGLRLNVWTSLLVFAFGAWWFRWLGRRTTPVPAAPAPEEPPSSADAAPDPAADDDPADDDPAPADPSTAAGASGEDRDPEGTKA